MQLPWAYSEPQLSTNRPTKQSTHRGYKATLMLLSDFLGAYTTTLGILLENYYPEITQAAYRLFSNRIL